MSIQTQIILFQSGSVNEVLNAIKTELHKDIFNYDKVLQLESFLFKLEILIIDI